MSLGTNISYLRKQKKLTQEQFVEIMRVTRQTVSRWEADEVTPELAKLVDICFFLHVNWMRLSEKSFPHKAEYIQMYK